MSIGLTFLQTTISDLGLLIENFPKGIIRGAESGIWLLGWWLQPILFNFGHKGVESGLEGGWEGFSLRKDGGMSVQYQKKCSVIILRLYTYGQLLS